MSIFHSDQCACTELYSMAEKLKKYEDDSMNIKVSQQFEIGKSFSWRVGNPVNVEQALFQNWSNSRCSEYYITNKSVQEVHILCENFLKLISSELQFYSARIYLVDNIELVNLNSSSIYMAGQYPQPDSEHDSISAIGDDLIHQVLFDNRPLFCKSFLNSSTPSENETVGVINHNLLPIAYEGQIVGVLELSSAENLNESMTLHLAALCRVTGLLLLDLYGKRVSEQRLKELDNSNNLLVIQKNALDCAAIVAETDIRGRITYVNDKFLEISKYNRLELMGRDHRILNSGLHSKEFFKELWSTIHAGLPWHGEIRNKTKNGEFYWVDTTIYPVKDVNGEIQKFVSIRFDITEKKRVVEELQVAHDEARQAAKIKSEFLANMSHEIRTPLNAIIGMSEILTEMQLSSEQQRVVETISTASETLLDLINNILDLSKIESGRFSVENISFNLEELIDSTCAIVAPAAYKKGICLVKKISETLKTHYHGDPGRIRQVLINLLGNAIKFTSKGEVVLSVNISDDDSRVLVFSVKDSGIGIPSDKIKLLFQNFSQVSSSTSSEYGGSGLGLAISKKIVQAMGGDIFVNSELGSGSEFTFKIKLSYLESERTFKQDFDFKVCSEKVDVVDLNSTSLEVISNFLDSYKINYSAHRHLEDIVTADGEILILNGRVNEEFKCKIGSQIFKRYKKIVSICDISDQLHVDKEMISQLNIQVLAKPWRRRELLDALILQRNSVLDSTESVSVNQQSVSVGTPTFFESKSILLVEDVQTNVDLILAYLKSLPFEVHVARNGHEALTQFDKNSYDLILMDVQMPLMDGREATRQIRHKENLKNLKRTKILALTAHATHEEINESLKAGCDGHIVKPIKKSTLLSTLKFHFSRVA